MGCGSSTGVSEQPKAKAVQDVNVHQEIHVELQGGGTDSPDQTQQPARQIEQQSAGHIQTNVQQANGVNNNNKNTQQQQQLQQQRYVEELARKHAQEMDEYERNIHAQMEQLRDPGLSNDAKIELLEKIRIALRRKHKKMDQDLAQLEKDLGKEKEANSVDQVLVIYQECIVKVQAQLRRNEVMQAKVTEVETDKKVLEDKHQIGQFMSFLSSELEVARHAYDVDEVVMQATKLKKSEDKMAVDQAVAGDAIDDVLGL